MVEGCSSHAVEPEKLTARGLDSGADLSADAFEVQRLAVSAIAEVKPFRKVAGPEAGRIGANGNRHGLEALGMREGPTFAGQRRSYVVLKGNGGQHHQQPVVGCDVKRKRKS